MLNAQSTCRYTYKVTKHNAYLSLPTVYQFIKFILKKRKIFVYTTHQIEVVHSITTDILVFYTYKSIEKKTDFGKKML